MKERISKNLQLNLFITVTSGVLEKYTTISDMIPIKGLYLLSTE